jgi:hypothetical protein
MILKIFLLIIIIPVIIIFTVFMVNILPFPEALDGSRNLIGAISAGFFSFLYLIFIFFYTIHSFRKAGRIFDDICLESGLNGKSFSLFGRKYSGIINKRQIIIEYFPPRMIQRALLNIYIETSLAHEFIISRQKPLLGNSKNRIDICSETENLAGGFRIYSGDCKGILTIISNPEFKKALKSILLKGFHNSFKQVYFENGRIWLRERYSRSSVEVLKDYIKDLLVLAKEAEDQ